MTSPRVWLPASASPPPSASSLGHVESRPTNAGCPVPSALCGWRSDVLPSSRSFQGLNRLHPRTAGGAPLAVSGAASGLCCQAPSQQSVRVLPTSLPHPPAKSATGRAGGTRQQRPSQAQTATTDTKPQAQPRFQAGGTDSNSVGGTTSSLQDCTVLSSLGPPCRS